MLRLSLWQALNFAIHVDGEHSVVPPVVLKAFLFQHCFSPKSHGVLCIGALINPVDEIPAFNALKYLALRDSLAG